MVEVYTFRGLSNEEDSFYLEISVRSDQTFMQFHKGLQEGLGYDKGQIASFYLTNRNWEKEKEVTLIDMSDEQVRDILNMEDTRIKELIIGEKTRLVYVFDFFFERAIHLELINKELSEVRDGYPTIVQCTGTIPSQIIAPGETTGPTGDAYDEDDLNSDIRFEPLDDMDI